jgi:hypothetical protein
MSPGRPVYDPNPFRVDSNPLILCRVRVRMSSRVKIAGPSVDGLDLIFGRSFEC